MNCQQTLPLIDPYADGELEAAAVLELERHLRGCSDCSLAWHNLQSLKKMLQSDSLYFTAGAELRRRIRAELPSPAMQEPWRLVWTWNWLTTGLSGAFAVCLALLLIVVQTRPSPGRQLAQEIVSSHIRSLMPGHTLDVVSTDQHTVKPWFNGKLDFSPPVRDLASHQFPLIGGRIDYLGGRSVAALVFQRNKHVINLFIWPANENESMPAALAPGKGYNLIRWVEANMAFWAVSDLNEKELMEFVRDFQQAKRSTPD